MTQKKEITAMVSQLAVSALYPSSVSIKDEENVDTDSFMKQADTSLLKAAFHTSFAFLDAENEGSIGVNHENIALEVIRQSTLFHV